MVSNPEIIRRGLPTKPPECRMSIAGHVSQQMLAHYSHVRIEAKRKALDALAVAVQTVGYDTISDTNKTTGSVMLTDVLEKNGGDDETRTRDLCRDSSHFCRN
jgi:hypothetical protein